MPQFERSMLGVLRHRRYRRYWIASMLSTLGTMMYLVGLNWIVLEQRGPKGLAIIALMYGTPQFALELIGGHIADRFQPRRVLLLTETAMTAAAVAMALSLTAGTATFPLLCALQLGVGALSAFDSPARNQLVARLVPYDEIVDAQAVFTAGSQVGSFLGPAIGGVLLYFHDMNTLFWANAVSFFPSLLFFLSLPRMDAPPSASREPLLQSLQKGLRYVAEERTVRGLILTALVSLSLGMPYQTLLPVFVHDVLQLPAATLATLSAAAGLGAMIGVTASVLLAHSARPGKAIVVSALLFGLFLALFSQIHAIYRAMDIRHVYTHGVVVLLASALGTLTLTLGASLLQSITPDHVRGRVTSISFMNKGVAALTAALAAFLVHLAGAPTVLLVMAGLMVPLVLWTGRPVLEYVREVPRGTMSMRQVLASGPQVMMAAYHGRPCMEPSALESVPDKHLAREPRAASANGGRAPRDRTSGALPDEH